MNCPIDGTQLLMSERNGIEIDYCPSCRGIWLDRGELDKILERSRDEFAPQVTSREPERHYASPGDSDRHDSRRGAQGYSRSSHYDQRRKKSPFEFLGELFE